MSKIDEAISRVASAEVSLESAEQHYQQRLYAYLQEDSIAGKTAAYDNAVEARRIAMYAENHLEDARELLRTARKENKREELVNMKDA